jgi:hypothetical protein
MSGKSSKDSLYRCQVTWCTVNTSTFCFTFYIQLTAWEIRCLIFVMNAWTSRNYCTFTSLPSFIYAPPSSLPIFPPPPFLSFPLLSSYLSLSSLPIFPSPLFPSFPLLSSYLPPPLFLSCPLLHSYLPPPPFLSSPSSLPISPLLPSYLPPSSPSPSFAKQKHKPWDVLTIAPRSPTNTSEYSTNNGNWKQEYLNTKIYFQPTIFRNKKIYG